LFFFFGETFKQKLTALHPVEFERVLHPVCNLMNIDLHDFEDVIFKSKLTKSSSSPWVAYCKYVRLPTHFSILVSLRVYFCLVGFVMFYHFKGLLVGTFQVFVIGNWNPCYWKTSEHSWKLVLQFDYKGATMPGKGTILWISGTKTTISKTL